MFYFYEFLIHHVMSVNLSAPDIVVHGYWCSVFFPQQCDHMEMAPIKTAVRVCEVFELFNAIKRPLSLKDCVQSLHYPVSSASALLKSLTVLGYLDYDLKRRAYFPTMRMPTMTAWIEKARFGNGSVLSAMQHLSEVTLETISLAVQSDLHAQYIHQIPTQLSLPYRRIRQTIRPLARSGLGWLMLSAWDDDMVEHLVRRLNHAARNTREKAEVKEVLEKVRQIRRDGFVFSKHTLVKGAGMIGMLIPSAKQQNERRFAMCIQGPVTRLEDKRRLILRELASVTHAIGALGGIR